MSNNSSLSRRAALRQQQELEERTKKTKRIVGAGLGLLVLTAVVVLAIVIFQAIGASTDKPVAEVQLTPANATDRGGILLFDKEPTADKPHLIVYQDYQCPWCAAYETAFGTPIEELVESGRITAEYRTIHFLDTVEDGPSRRAAVAAAAANEVGFFSEYQKTIVANHKESVSAYPARQLRDDFAKEAGITGDALTKFQELFDTRAFNDFTATAQDSWRADGLTSTPIYLVSGERLPGLVDNAGQPTIPATADAFYGVVSQAWQQGGKEIEKKPAS